MRLFYTIFQSILLVILLINPFLFILFGEELILLSKIKQILILLIFMIFQFLVIIYFIKKYFHEPILILENTIKNVLVGNFKNTNIELKKTINPHLNYCILFFSKTLNTLKNIKDEFLHGKEIRSEVDLGKEIQGKMLTKKLIQVPNLEVIVKSKPAGEIGGDSYDIIKEGNNYFIYVGDATGHGVGAGFIMIMVNALISGFSKIYKSGAHILAKTNEILKPRVKANLLMSLLLVRWDNNTKKLYMTGAGHEYLMIYKYKKNKTYRIKSGGVALGMIKDISKLLKEKEISFEENDLIVLYSDGITEAINRPRKDGKESMFGEDKLETTITNSPNVNGHKYKSARSVFNNITIELSKFMGYKHVQLDDITLAVIHYKGAEYDIANDFNENIEDEFITEWKW